MVEAEKSGGADQSASEIADAVGWLVRLEITYSHAPNEEPTVQINDAARASNLDDVIRLIEADFRRLTIPLLGRRERVLPTAIIFRFLSAVPRRWRHWLYEKTGDKSQYQVSIQELKPEVDSELIDEGSKGQRQVEVRIVNVTGEPVSSHALLGRFHPDHREPNIFDALEETRRLFEERRRKENEGG